MISRKLLLSAALPGLLAFSAVPASAETLKVVASFTVLADVVKQVGGNHVAVTSLVGPNGDPHEFEPSPADAKHLKAAQVTFVSGEGLEGWMDRLITASGYKGTPVTVSDGVNTRTMEEDGQTVTDPHVWNSPVNVKVWVANIEKAMSEADPADAGALRLAAGELARHRVLTTLDAEIGQQLERAFLRLRGTHPGEYPRYRDILPRIEERQQIVRLEDEADLFQPQAA